MQSQSVGPRALYEMISQGDTSPLLDVRTPAEYEAAHVARTTLIPLDRLQAAAFLQRHTDAKRIYVFCQSGMRACKAVEKFKAAGFDGCFVVEGGTQAWMDAGLPVNRGKGNVLPLMRQVQVTVGAISAVGAALALFVERWFALVPLVMGSGLLFAGLSGFCGLALLLARMPWNCSASGEHEYSCKSCDL